MGHDLRVLELPVASDLEAAIADFDCCGDDRSGDPVCAEVRDFLREHAFIQGIEQGFSTTYVLLDLELDPLLLGYLTLSIDSVRLSDSEKQRLGDPPFADFGAIRIAMIGVDVRHERMGLGDVLLDWTIGAARAVSSYVAVRFLVADANINVQRWYEKRHFELNRSASENPNAPGRTTVSMRLDLQIHE